MSHRSISGVLLTQRALRDFQRILDFSTQQWGKRIAEEYVNELSAGLDRLKNNPELLRPEPELHPVLKFYRVNKHLFICDVKSKSVVVLTVIHASMDIPSRLAELQPTLAAEVEMLHRKLLRS